MDILYGAFVYGSDSSKTESCPRCVERLVDLTVLHVKQLPQYTLFTTNTRAVHTVTLFVL